MGVGVARAAGDEKRDGAWVVSLDAVLGVAGEIGGNLHHVGAKRGVVAGISEHDGHRLAARLLYPEGGHAFVRRTPRGLSPPDTLCRSLSPVPIANVPTPSLQQASHS